MSMSMAMAIAMAMAMAIAMAMAMVRFVRRPDTFTWLTDYREAFKSSDH